MKKFFVFLFVMLFCSFALAKTADELLSDMFNAYNSGKDTAWDDTITAADLVLVATDASNVQKADALHYKAKAQGNKLDWDSCIATHQGLLTNYATASPKNQQAMSQYFIGYCYYQKEAYDTAISELGKVTTNFTEAEVGQAILAQATYYKGECYYAKTDYDNAITVYKSILQNYPKASVRTLIDTCNRMGVAYWRKEDYDKAIAAHKKAIEDYPTAPATERVYAYKEIVGLYKAQGKSAQAINYVLKLFEDDVAKEYNAVDLCEYWSDEIGKYVQKGMVTDWDALIERVENIVLALPDDSDERARLCNQIITTLDKWKSVVK